MRQSATPEPKGSISRDLRRSMLCSWRSLGGVLGRSSVTSGGSLLVASLSLVALLPEICVVYAGVEVRCQARRLLGR